MLNEIMLLKPLEVPGPLREIQGWGSRVENDHRAGPAALRVSPSLEDRTRDSHEGSFPRGKPESVCPRPPGGLHWIQQLGQGYKWLLLAAGLARPVWSVLTRQRPGPRAIFIDQPWLVTPSYCPQRMACSLSPLGPAR